MLSVYPWLQNVVAAATVGATAIAAGLLLRFRRDCGWGCGAVIAAVIAAAAAAAIAV